MRLRLFDGGIRRAVVPLLVGAMVTGVLAGCAAGSPKLSADVAATAGPEVSAAQMAVPPSTPSPTSPPIVQAQPTAAARATSTRPFSPVPTAVVSPSTSVTPRPSPPANDGSGLSRLYDRGTSGRMEVALTFDAGADRGKAEQILDILAKRGVKASFGITGHWAKENPDLVKRMVADGHMIFNHTWTHRSYTGYSTSPGESVIDTAERIKEITDTADEIKSLTGYETAPYFRPPYGDYDDSSLTDVAAAGYWVSVMWTCDSLGWNGASTDQIIARCGAEGSKGAVRGGIILMHVGAASLDAEALPGLIDALEGQGFALVTVEQLLQK